MTKIKMPSYDILIKEGLFQHLFEYISLEDQKKVIFIITDANVFDLYHDKIKNTFKGLTYHILSVKPGEQSKSFESYQNVILELIGLGIKRDALIIALGGGVVGDLAGFIASTLYRGIEYIQIPTTLLAMVDSSIGGKTGINLPFGKNLIGSFYQPKAVFIDPHFLDTLDQLEYENGVAEMIKAGLIGDIELYESIKSHQKMTLLDIERAILVKKHVVEVDPFDHKERIYLNFGHTFGHAIEVANNYQIKHGAAIGYGMLLALKIGIDKGITPKSLYKEVFHLLNHRGLIEAPLYEKNELLKYIKFDKKQQAEGLKFVLIKMIGTPLVINISEGDL